MSEKHPQDVEPANECRKGTADIGQYDNEQNAGHFIPPKPFYGRNIFRKPFKIPDRRLPHKRLDEPRKPASSEKWVQCGKRRSNTCGYHCERMGSGDGAAEGGKDTVPDHLAGRLAHPRFRIGQKCI